MARAPDEHDATTTTLAGAWATALERHRHAWWAYALHLTRDHDASEDLVQEMLTSVMTRGVRPDEVTPGYPFRVMKHAWISWSRKRRTRDEHAARLANATSPDAHDHTDLGHALAELSDDEREVLTLKHAGGLTLEQIALATDRPLGTVAGQHRRAMRSLRERLTNEEERAR